MATFTDRLRILVDWDSKSADSGVKGFVNSIKNAEGASGKLKAGWSSASSSIQANAGALAVGAGAALVAFGAKAVGAFSDTAKAAIDFGKASGFAVEDASRWIAVADDYQISADGIASATARISRSLDDEKWAKYGIATRDASGAARSTNDIFLDTLDLLSKTSNATERSAIAFELMGKGWQSIAPLIGKTRGAYEDMLAAVEDGQVITEGEADRAEKWRLALDDLGDALNDLMLQLGGVIAAGAGFIKWTSDSINKVQSATKAVWNFGDSVVSVGDAVKFAVTGPFKAWDDTFGALTPSIGHAEYQLTNLAGAVDTTTSTVEESSDAWSEHEHAIFLAGDRYPDMTQALKDAADAAREAEQAVDDMNSALRASVDSQFAVQKAQDDWIQSLQDLYEAVDDPKTNINEFDQALRNTEESAFAMADAQLRMGEQMAEANGTTLSAKQKQDIYVQSLKDTASTLDPNSQLYKNLMMYIAGLERIPANIVTNLRLNTVSTGAGLKGVSDLDGKRASGGPVNVGGAYLVGEEGPELFVPGSSGSIIPNGGSAGAGMSVAGGGITLVFNGIAVDQYTLDQFVTNALTRIQRDGVRIPGFNA